MYILRVSVKKMLAIKNPDLLIWRRPRSVTKPPNRPKQNAIFYCTKRASLKKYSFKLSLSPYIIQIELKTVRNLYKYCVQKMYTMHICICYLTKLFIFKQISYFKHSMHKWYSLCSLSDSVGCPFFSDLKKQFLKRQKCWVVLYCFCVFLLKNGFPWTTRWIVELPEVEKYKCWRCQ